METEISKAAETTLTIWEIAAPIITAAVGWVAVKVSGWIQTKTKNERVGGMLGRLVSSVQTAVVAVNETAKAEIMAAKDPTSPGGSSVTKAEAEQLKAACLDKIKAYWGTKGLAEAAKVLGFGGGGIDSFLSDEIEKSIATLKGRTGNPQKPAGLQ